MTDLPPDGPAPSPLEALGTLAASEAAITDGLDHIEMYTRAGLLTLLWHGSGDRRQVVLMVGGAMGGMLGPGRALYHQLGVELASAGFGVVRVGYRVPNDIDLCVLDTMAAAEMAARGGARGFVVIGHSFGGAVAIQTGAALGDMCAGVVTAATQAGDCEPGEVLTCPVLHLHGDRDELLPPMASQMVQMLTGGELVIYPGAGHMLSEAHDEMSERLAAWIPEAFAAHPSGG